MKRTTIFADESLLAEISALAKEDGRSAAELCREALERYIRQRKARRRRLSFVGVGASGKQSIAEQHESLLWRNTKP